MTWQSGHDGVPHRGIERVRAPRRRSAAFGKHAARGGVGGTRVERLRRRRGPSSVARLYLLGPVRFGFGEYRLDLPSVRWVALLAYLGRSGGWVRRDVLATLFWPDHDDHGASLNLRQTLQTIVRSPTGVGLEREPTRVRWTGTCDTDVFDALVAEQRWDVVVQTYAGAFLDGLDVPDVPNVQEWIDAERAGLHARWRTAALLEGRNALAEGRCLDVLTLAERLCQTDPFDDEALRLLLEASVRCGDRTRAERAFTSARRAFERELGVEPEPETMALARALRLSSRRG